MLFFWLMETTELLDFWNTRHRSSDDEAVSPAAVPVLVRAEPPDGLTPKTALFCCCPNSSKALIHGPIWLKSPIGSFHRSRILGMLVLAPDTIFLGKRNSTVCHEPICFNN